MVNAATVRRKKYQALVNLSVPMPVLPGVADEKRTILVPPGETIELTEQQAHHFLHELPRPAIRPVAEGSEPLPRITGRDLSGRAFGPPADARRDPAGSSGVIVTEIPEASEPQPGDEQGPDTDAVDLPPSGAAQAAAARVRAGSAAGG